MGRPGRVVEEGAQLFPSTLRSTDRSLNAVHPANPPGWWVVVAGGLENEMKPSILDSSMRTADGQNPERALIRIRRTSDRSERGLPPNVGARALHATRYTRTLTFTHTRTYSRVGRLRLVAGVFALFSRYVGDRAR